MAKMPDKFTKQPCRHCGTPQAVVSHVWLRWRRQAAGVTLRTLADGLGFSAPYLCDIEYGRRPCTPKVRAAYEALGK
jgi:predicted transcriptional regulator